MAARLRLRATEKRRWSSTSRASASAIREETEASRSAAKRLSLLRRSRGKFKVMFCLAFTNYSVAREIVVTG